MLTAFTHRIGRRLDAVRAGLAGWLQDFYVNTQPMPSIPSWRFRAWQLGTWLYH